MQTLNIHDMQYNISNSNSTMLVSNITNITNITNTTELFEFTDYDSFDYEAYFKTINFPKEKHDWRPMPAWEVAIKILLYIPIVLMSLIGNGLIFIVLLKKKSLRQSVTNVFIINLIISDILVTCTSTWVHLVEDFGYKWMLGQVFCKFNVFMQVVSLISSVLTMTAISIERFFGIVTPFSFCSHQKAIITASVVSIWVVAIAVAIPPSVFTNMRNREWLDYSEVWCHDVWPTDSSKDPDALNTRALYFTIVAVLLYALPLLVMTLAYAAIILKLRAKQTELGEVNNNSQKVKNSSRRKVVIMLIILLVVFTVCWFPFQFSMLYYEYYLHKKPKMPEWVDEVRYFSLYMSYANSALNPVIFICFSQKIRKAIYTLLCVKKRPRLFRSPASSRYGSMRSSTRRTWV